MAEVSNRAGLGQDGYLQYQAETTYKTPATGSEIDLPAKEGSLIKAYPEDIENMNIIADRTKQVPQSGRIIVEGQIIMDMWPTLLGGLFVWAFGAAAGSSAVGDGAYTNYWFIPKTGLNAGKSATITQALGILLADRFDGCVIDSFTISQDNQGNAELTLQIRGAGYTEDIARETTWSFPVSSSNPPFNFGQAKITATPSGGSQVTLCADSLSVTVNFNHNLDRYKVCSAVSAGEIEQPTYNSIPSVEISMNVDADQYLIEYARSRTQWDITIDWTSTIAQAGSTPTYYAFATEFPGCLLAPDTEIPNSNDYLNMDLSFDCSFGGTTTNSGAAIYQGEMRLVSNSDLS